MSHPKRVSPKSSTSDFVQGLYVKDGRLINDRPDGVSGIQQAANIKRAVKNDRKINQIAEGIQLAENKKKWKELNF
jgi:hypothetical protein